MKLLEMGDINDQRIFFQFAQRMHHHTVCMTVNLTDREHENIKEVSSSVAHIKELQPHRTSGTKFRV